jgi:hypothetical protein
MNAQTKALRPAWRFFLENGGYSTPPGRAACALESARSEALLTEAIDADVCTVEWHNDPEPDFETREWTGPYAYGCVLEVNGEHVASLWGIVLGSRDLQDPYRRVVEAELASEASDELRQAIGDARDAAAMDAYTADVQAGMNY